MIGGLVFTYKQIIPGQAVRVSYNETVFMTICISYQFGMISVTCIFVIPSIDRKYFPFFIR